MKKLLPSLVTLTLLGCNTYQQPILANAGNISAVSVPKAENTTTGDIRYHNLKTKNLRSGQRDIVVYLPPSYKSNPGKKYPVLYMHDGQNIFDKATGAFGKEWYIDEKVEYLIKKNVIEEIIIVGIYNGMADRLHEYTWNPMPGYGGGGGKSYGEFLTGEVKPFIDKNYRTLKDRNNTAVTGSSLGGLISFYLARNYSEIFSKIGMMSPSIWWNEGESINEAGKLRGTFDFWLDAGTEESKTMVGYLNRLGDKLESQLGSRNVSRYIDKGAGHNEEAWAVRIHGPLIRFFGKEKDPAKKEALIKRLMIYEEWAKL